MSQFDDINTILCLAGAAGYRHRTQKLFDVTWYQVTEDGNTQWRTEDPVALLNIENAWARDRLEHFNGYFHDNIYIAEGQYISGCIGATCFRVTNFLDQLILEAERERRREVHGFYVFLRRARILAQELVSLHFLHVFLQQLAYWNSVTRA
ncbi:hypothetical protein Focb16_v006782 [Fusarium oxysporum f. sp. cubense]|uniref:Uncharacterized protein n=1 Tax=Fusarium oxysporum f. sp. cubense TaxID=61366 RepID=A0A559LSC5_FUSOC|nr:hypothetical protein Focb16_v006782 [Fusarium oxysporum f. sp. cubense]